MRVCLTAQGDNLEAIVEPRFGRTEYFVIVDSDTMNYKAIRNPAVNALKGAGIQAAQFLTKQGVDLLITGHLGPNAMQALASTHIQVAFRTEGTIREALDQFKRGELKPDDTQSAANSRVVRGRRYSD